MRRLWGASLALLLAVRFQGKASADPPPAVPPPSACPALAAGTVFTAIVAGGDVEMARCVVRHANQYSAFFLRPALLRVASDDGGGMLVAISGVLAPEPAGRAFDATTRAYAAGAIGRIAGRQPGAGTAGPPAVVARRLGDCIVEPTDRILRHACIVAAARGSFTELLPQLESAAASSDALVAFAAARALTSLTGVNRVAPDMVDRAQVAVETFLGVP